MGSKDSLFASFLCDNPIEIINDCMTQMTRASPRLTVRISGFFLFGISFPVQLFLLRERADFLHNKNKRLFQKEIVYFFLFNEIAQCKHCSNLNRTTTTQSLLC